MFLATCHPVLLFVAWLQAAAAAAVEPPTNVTLHCRNLHNVLEWSYDRPSQKLRFRVDFQSYRGHSNEIWVDPPALRTNLSFLSHKSDDEYYVTVTAVIEQNESAPAPPDGITFSYFKDSPVNQICLVDLPSVQVTAQKEDTVQFSFQHPSLLLPKLPGASKKKIGKKKRHNAENTETLPVFTYDVVILSQKEPHNFQCQEDVCCNTLPVDPAQQEHCLQISGELEKMSVQATQVYCAKTETPHESNNYIYIYIFVGVLALIVVVFIFLAWYRKMTTSSMSTPSSMLIRSGLKRLTMGLVQEPMVLPHVEPNSPSPLLSTEESGCTLDVQSTSEHEPPLTNAELSDEDAGESSDMEAENNDGAGYEPGSNLEQEEASSGYEKREVLVNLAPDEQAEAYRHCGTGDL